MNSTPIHILFLHGLNTFGDDLLHIGPVTLGRMDLHLRAQFEKLGARVFSVDGVGQGSPEAQTRIAQRDIEARCDFANGVRVFLLGNSMGGIVARSLAKAWRETPSFNTKQFRVDGILSWGTPHYGTRAAALALEITTQRPRLVRTISRLGYNLAKNNSTYEHYTPLRMKEFNRRHPIDPETPEHSFLCALPFRKSSPYFWGLYAKLHGLPTSTIFRHWKSEDSPSDGFISIESQTWGTSHTPYRLDHFSQSGFLSMLPVPSQRQEARIEFEKLCTDMEKVMTAISIERRPRSIPRGPVEEFDSGS